MSDFYRRDDGTLWQRMADGSERAASEIPNASTNPVWRTEWTLWAGWSLVGKLPTEEDAQRAVIGVCQAVRDTGAHVRIVPMRTCLPVTRARR